MELPSLIQHVDQALELSCTLVCHTCHTKAQSTEALAEGLARSMAETILHQSAIDILRCSCSPSLFCNSSDYITAAAWMLFPADWTLHSPNNVLIYLRACT
jgi:hypothetical protein